VDDWCALNALSAPRLFHFQIRRELLKLALPAMGDCNPSEPASGLPLPPPGTRLDGVVGRALWGSIAEPAAKSWHIQMMWAVNQIIRQLVRRHSAQRIFVQTSLRGFRWPSEHDQRSYRCWRHGWAHWSRHCLAAMPSGCTMTTASRVLPGVVGPGAVGPAIGSQHLCSWLYTTVVLAG
jgi:hypothetical protein